MQYARRLTNNYICGKVNTQCNTRNTRESSNNGVSTLVGLLSHLRQLVGKKFKNQVYEKTFKLMCRKI